jgi:hypothetical protein
MSTRSLATLAAGGLDDGAQPGIVHIGACAGQDPVPRKQCLDLTVDGDAAVVEHDQVVAEDPLQLVHHVGGEQDGDALLRHRAHKSKRRMRLAPKRR